MGDTFLDCGCRYHWGELVDECDSHKLVKAEAEVARLRAREERLAEAIDILSAGRGCETYAGGTCRQYHSDKTMWCTVCRAMGIAEGTL